jgi:ABC-type branched-subunit amino acid transport system ATPase component
MSEAMNVLEIQGVTKRFGNLVAVRDVSLNVAKGEMCAIIGPNGAGKTTFFNLISGFFPPTSGTIRFDGQDITKLATHERVARGMARTFQITEIFPELTVFENVRIAAEVAGGYRRSNWCRWNPRPTDWSASSPMAISAPPKSRWRWRCGRICCCSTSRPPAWATRKPTRSPS